MGDAYFINYSITKNANDDYSIKLDLVGTDFQSESFIVQQDAHPWFNSSESWSVTLTASNVNWSTIYTGCGSSCKLTFRCKASKSSTWQDVITVYTPDEYSSEKLPSFYPEVTHQLVRGKDMIVVGEARTCVANSIATLKEIHEYKEGRTRYNRFSIGWIYGNRDSNHHQGEGMFVSEALDKLIQDGVPPYDVIPENINYNNPDTGYSPLRLYPDIYEYTNTRGTNITAKQLVDNNYNNVTKFALPQRIKSHSGYIHKSDAKIYNIKQKVINDGGVLVELNLYNEFYSANNNGGIVPEYFSGDAIDGHVMVIIGWKKINGISYWICHNNWGDWVGDNGIFYLPFWTNKDVWYYYVEDGVYPLPKAPTPSLDINSTVKTGNSIKVTINPVEHVEIYYARINGGNQQSSSGRTFTFTGLAPNTQYFIEIACMGSFYSMSDWAGYYATTLTSIPWEWHTPKTTGAGFNVTRAEWIAFCEKINEVRVAKGLSAYSFTTSTTYIDKDKPFYAWIWLQAANAINQINGQVASACLNVNSKSDIYAWYFDNLKTALNNAISS